MARKAKEVDWQRCVARRAAAHADMRYCGTRCPIDLRCGYRDDPRALGGGIKGVRIVRH